MSLRDPSQYKMLIKLFSQSNAARVCGYNKCKPNERLNCLARCLRCKRCSSFYRRRPLTLIGSSTLADCESGLLPNLRPPIFPDLPCLLPNYKEVESEVAPQALTIFSLNSPSFVKYVVPGHLWDWIILKWSLSYLTAQVGIEFEKKNIKLVLCFFHYFYSTMCNTLYYKLFEDYRPPPKLMGPVSPFILSTTLWNATEVLWVKSQQTPVSTVEQLDSLVPLEHSVGDIQSTVLHTSTGFGTGQGW